MNAVEAKKRVDEYYCMDLLCREVRKTAEQMISNYSATGNFCLNITAGDFEHVPWKLSPKQRERYRGSVSETMFLSEYFVRFREAFCQTMRWVAKELSKNGFYAELKNSGSSPFLFVDWADAVSEEKHRWIPVTEKLPEENKSVLIKYNINGEEQICIGYYAYYEPSEDEIGYGNILYEPHFENEDDHITLLVDYKIIAWQPLPEVSEEKK